VAAVSSPPVGTQHLTCPFCDSASVERIGQWGGQSITAQWRCRECGSYFEALRDDFDDKCHETEM
jgi:transposase-like protein